MDIAISGFVSLVVENESENSAMTLNLPSVPIYNYLYLPMTATLGLLQPRVSDPHNQTPTSWSLVLYFVIV